MKKLHLLLAVAATLFILQSCEKEKMPEGDAPRLPAEASFVMPFNDIQELDNELGGDEVAPRSFDNFGHAAVNVVVWNALIKLHMGIPVLAFKESFNHQAVYQGGGIWLWAYSAGDNSGTYNIKLYGELLPGTEETKWDMYISKVGGFTDVHWYTGITAWDDSYANWTLNHKPFNPTPFIEINYERDLANGQAFIRYTNSIPGDAGNGAYIEHRHGAIDSTSYDRAYDVFNIGINNLLEIQWNSTDKLGRVKDEQKFGDSDWHCWDIEFKDTDC